MTHRLWREGMNIVEVPIIFTDRFQGHSKMSREIMFEAFWMVWRLWFQNGMRRRPKKKFNPEERPRTAVAPTTR
jgi:dolichol-phosphate mannosyltransferase